jgi:hypothetical protein
MKTSEQILETKERKQGRIHLNNIAQQAANHNRKETQVHYRIEI